jgi:hypothetical protein
MFMATECVRFGPLNCYKPDVGGACKVGCHLDSGGSPEDLYQHSRRKKLIISASLVAIASLKVTPSSLNLPVLRF